MNPTNTLPAKHVAAFWELEKSLKLLPHAEGYLRVGNRRMRVKLGRYGFVEVDGTVPSTVEEREIEIDLSRHGGTLERGAVHASQAH